MHFPQSLLRTVYQHAKTASFHLLKCLYKVINDGHDVSVRSTYISKTDDTSEQRCSADGTNRIDIKSYLAELFTIQQLLSAEHRPDVPRTDGHRR